ncbi:MAG: phosphoglucosamine mutase [Deltaproteobacteria bacterium]|nr:phosphoglucosamine mutase [Deltaproteobacteria bacterium]
MRKLFGTDGVRGKANIHPMTSEVALGLGRGIAQLFKQKGSPHKSRVVIGKDTRRSGYMFENALSSGVCSAGAEAILLGPLPTPAIAFITRAMRADAGVVISASHNPYYDNGIKFFDHEGFKLPDELEYQLEQKLNQKESGDLPSGTEIGRAFRVEDAPGRYIEFLKSAFPKDLFLEGIKIVVDCANGAAYKVAPVVFEELGAQVFAMGVSPNGFNINESCGALHPQNLSQKVKELGADIGVALDGDADRVVLCDEQGEILDGDVFLAIAALELKRKFRLNKNTVVATVMSNFALERFLKEQKIDLLRVQVGDRYVVEAMRSNAYNLGGEQSGHMVFLDHATTGDGLLAALQILAIMKQQGKKLSQLKKLFEPLPQVLENIKVGRREDFLKFPSLQKLLKDSENKLGEQGRLLLRYSGTEALVRIMVECENQALIPNIISDIKTEVLKVLA